jgi:short chain dehydrogenase
MTIHLIFAFIWEGSHMAVDFALAPELSAGHDRAIVFTSITAIALSPVAAGTAAEFVLAPSCLVFQMAVVTGGASGIGLAAAKAFVRLGLRLCIADLGEERLAAAASAVSAVASGGVAHVMTVAIDVSRVEEVTRLETAVRERFGGTDVLMNNAGVQPGSAMFGPRENGSGCSASISGALSTAPRYSHLA